MNFLWHAKIIALLVILSVTHSTEVAEVNSDLLGQNVFYTERSLNKFLFIQEQRYGDKLGEISDSCATVERPVSSKEISAPSQLRQVASNVI